ncbi:MAG: hemagglutinin protein [bacterium]|nr:hemagglutinin protein [bacterium]
MNRLTLSVALCAAFLSAPALAAPPGAQAIRAQPNATTPGTACQDVPKLGYSNGPLIQHVKIVNVFYSPGNKYKAMLEAFYTSITQSAYFDWLVEYNTTNYKIGRGSFLSSFEDVNPAPAATATVKTVNPETYLKGLLATPGKLPAPDNDTMYMIYFPDRIDPTDGSGSSCVQPMGQFCAYHASYTTSAGQLVRYGVMPDMDAAGCMGGCGPTGFPGLTDVSSHELIEAVTDPDNGTGWYDANGTQQTNCGEIGDICAVGGTMETAVIGGFTVQKEWSNKNSACIGTDPNAVVNDFTVAGSDVSVPVGGSATVTVTLTKKTGVAENVMLTAPTPPTGLTAAFAPASVTSDAGKSTLTISAAPTLMPGAALTLTVKGTGSAVSETADIHVTVVAPPDMAMSSGGTGGTGGGGSGGTGGAGGNGNNGGSSGCSLGGGGNIAGSWAVDALLLLGLALRRRRA